jgi:hypothetical protein
MKLDHFKIAFAKRPVPFRNWLLFLFLTMPLAVLAQSGSGTIQGTVQDATGAVVSGAAIHVANRATGTAVDMKSNESGFYFVSSLFAGNYSISVASSGMKTWQSEITLQVGQVAVLNPTLVVGSTTEVVVSSEAIQLATYDSPTISATLDNSRISQLPVNGRLLLTLTGLTTPGLEGGGQRANGNMGEALEYVQDGVPMTNRNFGGEANSQQAQLPDPDAIQEVRLETANSNALFSTPATGIITTKSGTNSFHGTAFETARNNAIGIAKVRQNPSNFSAPHYVRNEFGIALGGPITLPKIYNGRDRSFFFFAYERYSLRSFQSRLLTVPMTSWRNGDFSNLYNSAGVLQVLYDPATTAGANAKRSPFPGNKIDIGRISPLAKALYAITPAPTSDDNPLIAPNLNSPSINNATVPQFNFRLDHVFNEDNRAFLRFGHISQDQTTSPVTAPTLEGAGLPAGASGLQLVPVTTISAAIGYTHVFSPTFALESNVSQEWFNQYFTFGAQNFNVEATLGLPNNFGQTGFPGINGGAMPYTTSQNFYGEAQIVTNIDENFTKILGRHQLFFGGRYRHERFGYLPDRSADYVNFSNQATALLDPASGSNLNATANTGNANADMFLGAAQSYSNVHNGPYVHFRDQDIATYIQDNFHMSRALTLNLGLRWNIEPAPVGLTLGFDRANKALVMPKPLDFYTQNGYTTPAILTNLTNLGVRIENAADARVPETMLYNYDFLFSPRVGVAYMPFGSRLGTVIRGGFGRYIYPVPVRNSMKVPAGSVPFTVNYSMNYTAANQAPDGKPNYLLRSKQTIVAGENSSDVVDTSSTNAVLPGFSVATLEPHYAPASVIQANLTVEQPLPYRTVLRLTYLYNHGSNLDQTYSYNNAPSSYVYQLVHRIPLPTGPLAGVATRPYDQVVYGSNTVSQKTGYSTDNALQMNVQRLFKNGYAFQVYWVWSRAFRVGGNTTRDSILYPAENFAPGVLPSTTDLKAINRFENYILDIGIPEHRVAFNGIVDLPFGRNGRFFHNANRFVDALIGGYQIAGTGTVLTQRFGVSTSNWGPIEPVHVYKNARPIIDCRSGVCRKENLWFNGYIPPSTINAAKSGISGLPSDYAAYQTPINNTPGAANYGNNNVTLPLDNGSKVQVAYAPGPAGANPFSRTFLRGPTNYNADLSLFKVFQITEALKLRINVDAFNAFNIQGYTNPNSTDGTENFLNSYWTGRQVQLTTRLIF